MNKFVLAALATAALVPSVAAADFGVINHTAPDAYVAPANWNGFYAGVFGGVSTGPFDFSLVDTTVPMAMDFNFNGGGFLGGLQAGYDMQFDNIVVGAVADFALTNHRAEIGLTSPGAPGAMDIHSKLTQLGTVRARAGAAFDNVLAYVHGGLAYGRSETVIDLGGGAVVPGINSIDRWGYQIGAGVEYKVSETVSLQTEYAYTHFGSENIADFGGGVNLNSELGIHTVKAGVNFRF